LNKKKKEKKEEMSSGSAGSVELEDVSNQDVLALESQSLNEDEQQQQAAILEAQARAKRIQVKKVSPIRRFFSSIRVVFIIILVLFLLVSISVVGYLAIRNVRLLYQSFDKLNVEQSVQGIVDGVYGAMLSLFTRGMMSIMQLGQNWKQYGIPDNVTDEVFEASVAKVIHDYYPTYTEGPGPTDYEYLPFHLIMLWDENWNERVVYYRPCRNESDRTFCDLLPPSEAFVNVFDTNNLTLKYKDRVPKVFRELGETMKKKSPEELLKCQEDYMACTGIVSIPNEEGGPMIFNFGQFANMTNMTSMTNMTNMTEYFFKFDNWYTLIASNLLLLNQIVANRSGLCVSMFHEKEPGVPEPEKIEFDKKREKKLVMNPAALIVDPFTFLHTLMFDTGNLTLQQEYYQERGNSFPESPRMYCDNFYDHDDTDFVSKTRSYVSYTTFDFNKLEQDENNTIMLRFDYHNPLTRDAYHLINILVAIVSIIWILTIAGVFIYFDVQFLYPLDKMRKVRQNLIKTVLEGIDDEEKAKEIFGELTNDEALIQANGDEITVMLTLQDRVDALYSSVINEHSGDLNRIRSLNKNELSALRVMNIFMRRDDEALRLVLPGLMDPNELARFRRTTLNVRGQKGDKWLEDLSNAKHTFRTLKAIFSSNIAAQYFKAFCAQRGRSSVNSFFFIMDVSWLHQVESGARDGNEDFLSAMFSDSVAPSPASLSPRGPRSKEDLSSDTLASPESSTLDLQLPDHEANRPHHSHFAKSRSGNRSGSQSSASSSNPNLPKAADEDKKADSKKPKIPKLPIAGIKNNGGSSPAPGQTSPGRSNVPKFLTKIGEGIAHFIHESYFGKRSLAHSDMRHAALLGCSQIPDYLTLRDSNKVVYSPLMYDNLVAAVTKKFTSEVLPQFLNSVSFQVMVSSLLITGYFERKDGRAAQDKKQEKENEKEEQVVDNEVPEFKYDNLLKGMWQVSKPRRRQKVAENDEDDESSSSSSSTSSDEDDEDKNDNEDEKKPEAKKDSEKDDASSDDDDDDDDESSDDD